MKQPKFKVGDSVKMRTKTLYGEKEGVITRIEKVFSEVYEDGTFNSDGLMTLESTIDSISIPYTFDGETLVVEYPETDYGSFIMKARKRVSKFSGYSYCVKTEKMNTIYPERSLSKK